MSGFIKEFKEFISRGNVMDMAVGVIIGGAFSAIVTSLVEDVIMPIIAIPTKGADFTKMKLGPIMIGNLISAVINFLIIAFVLFTVIKAFNKAKALPVPGGEEEEVLTVKTCPYCKSEIDIEATRCPHCTSELPEEQ